MKTFSQFIVEAKQKLKMVRVYHGTSKSNAEKIKSDGFNDSEDGAYGSGVYSSTSRNVARRYSRDAGAASGKHAVDSGVVSSIIPSKKVKTIRQSSPESQEGRNKSKELRKSGQPAVRVKNAATGHETAKPGKGHEDEADYIISDTKVVNKGIEKNPRVFRPTKDQKLDQTKLVQMARDYYRGKPGTERPYVDRRKGTKKTQPIKEQKTFNQFVAEAKEAKPPKEVLAKIDKAYGRKHPGTNVDVSHDAKSGDLRINQLFVPPSQQGKGIGTRVMKGLTKYADKQKKRMTLNQDPDPGKKAKLAKFYKSHGFEKNRGRSRDFTTRDTDIRNPR
jgi:GNAT superfamily N-acetyltransferase